MKRLSFDLKQMDCFDYLTTLDDSSVDFILIDPPYEISRESGFSKGGGNVAKYGKHVIEFGDWDYEFNNLEIVIQECYRVLKKGGTLFCFYDLWKITTLKEYLEQSKFKQIRFAEWLKTNPVPINSKINYLSNAREIAVVAVKGGKPTFNSQYDNGVYRFPICHEKGRFHPTQKPLELIEAILLKHSNESDVVLDCFSGSGTTALACLKNNRSFVGCELDESFYRKSIERIEAHMKPLF